MRPRVGLTLLAVVALIVMIDVPASANIARGSFHETDLVSDIRGRAQFFDPNLVNPWGLSSSAASPIWVADNNAGVSTLYRGDGTQVPLVVTIPSPTAPTGQCSTAPHQISRFRRRPTA